MGNKQLNNRKNGNKLSNKKTIIDQGFTFLEFILVVSLLGLTSRLIVPSFITSLNKSRQKEASLIVNSIIKSTKSYYGIHSFLPKNIGQLSKFANYQKCNAKDVADGGRKACKNSLPTLVEKDDLMFFSPSGNYKINMDFSYAEKGPELFLVKANPNGGEFKSKGSAVVGCFNPSNGISFVKEFSGKKSEVGIQDYITCESEEEKKKQEEEKKKLEEEKKKQEEEKKKQEEEKKKQEEEKKKIEEEKKKQEEEKKKIEEEKKKQEEEKKKIEEEKKKQEEEKKRQEEEKKKIEEEKKKQEEEKKKIEEEKKKQEEEKKKIEEEKKKQEEEKKKIEEEKKKQKEQKKKIEEENEKNKGKLSSENFEENQNDRDLNMTTQELENMNKLNLKEDETLKSVGDLDETINKSITKTSSQKEINTKKVDLNLKEFDDSTEEKIEGPIPPWIR